MPRASKKAAVAEIVDETSAPTSISVDLDSFMRIRDSMVTGMAILQNSVQTLTQDYIRHTNAILGDNGPLLDIESAIARAREAGGELGHGGGGSGALVVSGMRGASPAKSVGGDGKKEKKKRAHDPNAPKRPLTPFFLYMQTARPIIANDLGPEAPKGAVSSEGTRRWATMSAHDKALWTDAYTDNLRLYHARSHSYKAGNTIAKDMSDEEAAAYADDHNIDAPTADAQLAGDAAAMAAPTAHMDGADGMDAAGVGRGTPKKGRGKKSTGGGGAAPALDNTIVPAGGNSIVPLGGPPMPMRHGVPIMTIGAVAGGGGGGAGGAKDDGGKKRKRSSKKADEPLASIEPSAAAAAAAAAATAAEPKAKKSRAKKAKGGE